MLSKNFEKKTLLRTAKGQVVKGFPVAGMIRKVMSQSSMSSAKKIQAGMAERGINMSEKTIRRRLSVDFGLKSYRPAQKPRLTKQ